MDERDRAQRVVGLKAIEAKAEDLKGQGADAFEIRSFIQRGKAELARQNPDRQEYAKAISAAEKAQNTF